MKTKLLGIVVAGLLGTALATTTIAQDRGRGFDGARGAGAGEMRGGPMRRGPAAAIAAQPERFIEHHDADADGKVSASEFVDARLDEVDRLFDRRDDDGDGQISLE